jgi:hypothetical protein
VSYLDEVEPGDEAMDPPVAPVDWEAKGRAEKVLGIVAALDAGAYAEGVDPHADAESIARKLRDLDSKAWHKIQKEAGFKGRKPPSEKTINAVLNVYERRVDIAGETEES